MNVEFPDGTFLCRVLGIDGNDVCVVSEADGHMYAVPLEDAGEKIQPAYQVVQSDKGSHFSLLGSEIESRLSSNSLVGRFMVQADLKVVLVGDSSWLVQAHCRRFRSS